MNYQLPLMFYEFRFLFMLKLFAIFLNPELYTLKKTFSFLHGHDHVVQETSPVAVSVDRKKK
jgi:hypothetical protein